MLFRDLAAYFDQLEATPSRKAMVELLGRMFADAGPDSRIERVIYFCQGRLVPFFVPLEIGLGEKLVAEAIAGAYETTREDVLARYGRTGDLGLVAAELAGERTPDEAPTVDDVYDVLYDVATSTGAGSVERKVSSLATLLRRLERTGAKHLARIPLGRLRLGIGDPTILDGLSLASTGSTGARKTLEAAYNRTSDLGLIAQRLRAGGVAAVEEIRVQVGKPIRPALAERLPTAEAIIAKLGACAIEPKYDGFRCQVHKIGQEISVYSRNLEDMSAMFPEIVAGARAQIRGETAIVEGEAVGFNPESEEFLPFQETSRRRRKYEIDEMARSLPLRLFLFDMMFVDGEDWTGRTYTERRDRLAALIAPDSALTISECRVIDQPAGLQAYLLEHVQNGLEGIMAKKRDSVYQAGARNFNWVKLKRTATDHLTDTVDGVIIGYIFGRGKRSAFGAGALLVGVYDTERDEFTSITKIGTGLSDAEWREIRERCDLIQSPERPARVRSLIQPSVWVEPRVVIEVLADEITRSPIHTAGMVEGEPGYALRFPRLVSFRSNDKRPEDATTVREIAKMYRQLSATRQRPAADADDGS